MQIHFQECVSLPITLSFLSTLQALANLVNSNSKWNQQSSQFIIVFIPSTSPSRPVHTSKFLTAGLSQHSWADICLSIPANSRYQLNSPTIVNTKAIMFTQCCAIHPSRVSQPTSRIWACVSMTNNFSKLTLWSHIPLQVFSGSLTCDLTLWFTASRSQGHWLFPNLLIMQLTFPGHPATRPRHHVPIITM